MKKATIILSAILFIASGCKTLKDSTKHDNGVVINGVRWATRNVDEAGTFAPNPESAGKFYQWNRKKAWSTTDDEVENWNDTPVEGKMWGKANDPSPKGWHVPTYKEIESLLDKQKVTSEWTIINGVGGRKFTDKITGNSIFLPAVDFRFYSDGSLYKLVNKTGGYYWSSSRDSHIYYFFFYNNNAGTTNGSDNYADGKSIRSVANIEY
ncbi:hypothetical protein FACS189429_7850 [Bacteroidia bacterium]|nr:hypothetical protein FACS189429_7850 [Bacteroidia bacterium]